MPETLALWFTTRRSKSLIFISRSGTSSPDASLFIASPQTYPVRTAVLQRDISDALALSASLTEILKTFPPMRGIIQAAMSLNGSLFSTTTYEQWISALFRKVHGSKNLHEATLSQPLDFFILLSSFHSYIGNPGQANYASACAYQVALAKHRNALGLPATAIDLGIVGAVGYVADAQDAGKKVRVQDFKHISETEMLALIELGSCEPKTGHLVTGLDSDLDIGKMREDGNVPFFARDPVLSHLDYLRPHIPTGTCVQGGTDGVATKTLSLTAKLAHAQGIEQVREYVLAALLKKLSRSLMMNVEEVDASHSLSVYGTDSLVAAEMKNWIQRETKVVVSVFEILQAASIAGLADKIAEKVAKKKVYGEDQQ